MINEPSGHDRLERLLISSSDESFSDAEHLELNTLLRDDAAARKFAIEFFLDETILSEHLATSEAESLYAQEQANLLPEKEPVSFRKKIWLVGTAAACLLLTLSILPKKESIQTASPSTNLPEQGDNTIPPPKEVEPSVVKVIPHTLKPPKESLAKEETPSDSQEQLETPKTASIPHPNILEPKELTEIPKTVVTVPELVPKNQTLPTDDDLVLGLVDSVNNTSSDWQLGSELKTGEYELDDGKIEIRIASTKEEKAPSPRESFYDTGKDLEDPFPTGARLIIEGPARFDLRSPKHVVLYSGKISAEVFPIAKGFMVTANSVEIIDLGTRFAVTMDTKDDVAVHVYDGTVTGRVIDEKAETLTMRSGETVQLNPNSARLEKTEFEPELFTSRPKWNGEIEEHSPSIRVLERPPRAVDEQDLFPEDQAVIFKERANVTWRSDLAVFNLATPNEISPLQEELRKIPRGTKVTSYLIHSDIKAEEAILESLATIRFDSPILGLIYSREGLNESDRRLGASRTDYPTITGRGIEQTDKIRIHSDKRTLSINLRGGFYDQIRILVAQDL